MTRTPTLPRRDNYLTVPLNDDEMARFREAATKVRLPTATWARNFLLNALDAGTDE